MHLSRQSQPFYSLFYYSDYADLEEDLAVRKLETDDDDLIKGNSFIISFVHQIIQSMLLNPILHSIQSDHFLDIINRKYQSHHKLM